MTAADPIGMQGEYPLSWPTGWPRARTRRRGLFKPTTFEAARWRLGDELRKLGAVYGTVVISTNVALRLDGLPRSGGPRVEDPGVAVWFELALAREGKRRNQVLACDVWERVEHNAHALALHVEALRALDRYGVGTLEQAFTGYVALPERASPEGWRSVLGLDPRGAITRETVTAAFRARSLRAHPDQGGSAAELQRVLAARDQALEELEQEGPDGA